MLKRTAVLMICALAIAGALHTYAAAAIPAVTMHGFPGSKSVAPGEAGSAKLFLSNYTEEEMVLDISGAMLHRGEILEEYADTVILAPLTVEIVDVDFTIAADADLGRYRMAFVAQDGDGTTRARAGVAFIVKHPSPVEIGLTVEATDVEKGSVLNAAVELTNTSGEEVSFQIWGAASRRGPSRLRFGFEPIDVTLAAGETSTVDIALDVPSLTPAGRYNLRVLAGNPGERPWTGDQTQFLVIDVQEEE